ncbi:hypothetical protein FNV43_RR08415 [Rhamnella rubrinervis]|uniref:Uncharacterized protein n=1 Tax=Rhamnella rubrinervis TaxID=2594499 RepID=A0A8K0MJ24_9ROSA|nr:hypothetical protein FNV43_RR08415 [Rhamnella rubrinervis]
MVVCTTSCRATTTVDGPTTRMAVIGGTATRASMGPPTAHCWCLPLGGLSFYIQYLFNLFFVPMNSENIVIIAVFYDGTWFKGDDGRYQFKDQSKVIEIPKNCTYVQLIDEVYKIVKVDRERYNVKIKYQYIVSYQPCGPQELNSDQDVKIFIYVVNAIMLVTSLHVEIILNFAKVYSTDKRNNDIYAKFNAESRSTHISTSCATTKIEEREKKMC